MIVDDAPDDPLDAWKPTPGESARAAELWQMCLTDDPRFYEAFVATCDDVLFERNLPRLLAGILLHGRSLVEGSCTDRDLVQARLAADVRSARSEALGEAAWRD